MVGKWLKIAAEAAASGEKHEDGLPRFTFALTKAADEAARADATKPAPALYCYSKDWWKVVVHDRATGQRAYLTRAKLVKTIRYAASGYESEWFVERLYLPYFRAARLSPTYEACDLIGLTLKWPEFARAVVPYETQATPSVYIPMPEEWY
tara:strand:+ start:111 stop:563 length:453 start_codon:yes stop_codon:yes gene_type:complete